MNLLCQFFQTQIAIVGFILGLSQSQASQHSNCPTICELPNEVTQRIFSFLTYKQVVQSSGVSWQFYENAQGSKKEIIRKELGAAGFFEPELNLTNINLVKFIKSYFKREEAIVKEFRPSYKVIVLSNIVDTATFKTLCHLNFNTKILTYKNLQPHAFFEEDMREFDFNFSSLQPDAPYENLKYWTKIHSISLNNDLPDNCHDFFSELSHLPQLKSFSITSAKFENKNLFLDKIWMDNSSTNQPRLVIEKNKSIGKIVQSKSLQELELINFDISMSNLNLIKRNTTLKSITLINDISVPGEEMEKFQQTMAERGVKVSFKLEDSMGEN